LREGQTSGESKDEQGEVSPPRSRGGQTENGGRGFHELSFNRQAPQRASRKQSFDAAGHIPIFCFFSYIMRLFHFLVQLSQIGFLLPTLKGDLPPLEIFYLVIFTDIH
jgi:hypothetical protein